MKNFFIRSKWLYLSILIFLIYSEQTAKAQTEAQVERATRQVDITNRPQEIQRKFKKVPERPPKIEIKEEKPLPIKEEKFFVKTIKIVGIETFKTDNFSFLIKPYQNKELTLSDLERLAKEIQNEYIKQGILAAVFVPEQKITDNIVTLQVVEAKMGQLIIKEHKYFRESRLNYYWRIPTEKVIRVNEMSKSIQIMNKNTDRTVSADLKAGKIPGTTDVILTAATRRPLHVGANFDNEGAGSTGKSRTSAGLRHNNFLGLDDTFIAQYLYGRDYDGFYAFHSLPVSPIGTSVIYGYSKSFAKPKGTEQELGLESLSQNYSISVHQDIFNKDIYVGEMFMGFDAKEKTVTLNTGTFNRDRLRVFNLGNSLIFRGVGNTTTLSGTIYQGVEAFGASSEDNPLASRGANPIFTKFYADVRHRRILTANLQINLKLAGQIASNELTPQEQFALGGLDSVRGYPSGDYLADNAVVQSTELAFPAFFIPSQWHIIDKDPLRNKISGIIFADNGWGYLISTLANEEKSVYFLGVGMGLRFQFSENSNMRLEWGFPLGDETITESANSRFHFSVNINF